MQAQALEDWNSKYGGNEEYTKNTKATSGGFPFINDMTYHVRIKSAKVSKSSRNDRQITLNLAVLNPSEEEVGKHTLWLTLPKQPETDLQHDAEKVRKWTYRRRDDLAKVLGNVNRLAFGLYHRKEMDGNFPSYFDRDGNRMTKEQLDERQTQINKAVMGWVDSIHTEIEAGNFPELTDFEGAEFYIVRAANKSNPKYPYTNIYGDPSPKKPMWGGDADSETPF